MATRLGVPTVRQRWTPQYHQAIASSSSHTASQHNSNHTEVSAATRRTGSTASQASPASDATPDAGRLPTLWQSHTTHYLIYSIQRALQRHPSCAFQHTHKHTPIHILILISYRFVAQKHECGAFLVCMQRHSGRQPERKLRGCHAGQDSSFHSTRSYDNSVS